jgi:hypothetical protein
VRNPDDDPEAVAELLRGEIDGQDIDGFRYSVASAATGSVVAATGIDQEERPGNRASSGFHRT